MIRMEEVSDKALKRELKSFCIFLTCLIILQILKVYKPFESASNALNLTFNELLFFTFFDMNISEKVTAIINISSTFINV